MLDDIDPTFEWVDESHPTEYDLDHDFDIEGLGWDDLDVDPVVVGDAAIDIDI